MAPTRRDILAATAPIATELALAPFVRPASAQPAHLDAELLALRASYESTLAAMTRAADAHSPFEAAFFDRVRGQEDIDRDALAREIGLDVEEAKYEAAVDANTAVIHQITATPAQTIEGLQFKAKVSAGESNTNLDLGDAIMGELIALQNRR